jgi:polysaccharide deacetylase family protein (PEP-CTERM system associated)
VSDRAARHCFSVDVEEWFQVNAFEPYVDRDTWNSRESRVEASTDRILGLLADANATGTFFTLGWIADRHPALVRRIADAGHEIASHGYWHQRIPTITPEAFREDVRRAKQSLEQVAGVAVAGYRAPSFSLTDSVAWAAEVLIEEGHQYDSSRFPIRRSGYGSQHALTVPHWMDTKSGALLELPPAVWEVMGMRVPIAGGGWLRQLPFSVIRGGYNALAAAGSTGMFYIHPWELDPGQPRLPVPLFTRVRHYRGMGATAARIAILLSDASYVTARSYIASLHSSSLPRVVLSQ